MSERISIADIRERVSTRTRGYPKRWGPVCYGCGASEFRIDGFCSIECRDYHNDEDFDAVAALLDAAVAAHAWMICDNEVADACVDDLASALTPFDFGDA